MEKNLRALKIFLIPLSMLACGLFDFKGAMEMAKAISPDPNAVLIGEFQNSYPDSHPGVGLVYESSAEIQSLEEYYKDELEQQGWKITEVRNFDDFTKSVLISASKGSSTCYVTIEETLPNRKVTIEIE